MWKVGKNKMEINDKKRQRIIKISGEKHKQNCKEKKKIKVDI